MTSSAEPLQTTQKNITLLSFNYQEGGEKCACTGSQKLHQNSKPNVAHYLCELTKNAYKPVEICQLMPFGGKFASDEETKVVEEGDDDSTVHDKPDA